MGDHCFKKGGSYEGHLINRTDTWLGRICVAVMAVVDFITRLTAVLSGILLTGMVFMITVAVLLRYYFGLSVGWSTELAEYFIYLAVVLAAPWVLKHDGHVVVDIFTMNLAPETRRKVGIFVNLLGAAIGVAFAYYSLLATWENFVKGTETIRIMPIPRYLPLMFLPLMSVLFFFQFLRKAWEGFSQASSAEE